MHEGYMTVFMEIPSTKLIYNRENKHLEVHSTQLKDDDDKIRNVKITDLLHKYIRGNIRRSCHLLYLQKPGVFSIKMDWPKQRPARNCF